MLRILAVEGSKTYFDTNTSDHHHFFIEGENRVFDIAEAPVRVTNLPEPPEGMEIANVDIVVRLRRSAATERRIQFVCNAKCVERGVPATEQIRLRQSLIDSPG